MFSRLSISVLLLVAIFPSVTTFLAYPQQTATYTSTVAFTTALTVTSYRELTIATFTTLQQQNQYSGTITLTAITEGHYLCRYSGGPRQTDLFVTASHNDRIIGSISSDNPIDFYVLSDSYYDAWGGASGNTLDCSPNGLPDDVLVAQRGVTSLSIDLTINWPGKYRFVFINFDKTKTATINFNAGIAGSTIITTGILVTNALVTQLVTSTVSSLAMRTIYSPMTVSPQQATTYMVLQTDLSGIYISAGALCVVLLILSIAVAYTVKKKQVILDFSWLRDYMEKHGAVATQEVSCPYCGGSLRLPDKGTSTNCTHCGHAVYVKQIFDLVKELVNRI